MGSPRDDASVAHQVADIVRQSAAFTKGENKSTPFAGNMLQQDFTSRRGLSLA